MKEIVATDTHISVYIARGHVSKSNNKLQRFEVLQVLELTYQLAH